MTDLLTYRTWAREHGGILSAELRVLFEVLPDLSGHEFRPIKQVAVAKAIRIAQTRVSEKLARLVDEGYLEAGPRQGSCNTYRLNLTHYAIEHLVEQRRAKQSA